MVRTYTMTVFKIDFENGYMSLNLEVLFDTDDRLRLRYCNLKTLNEIMRLVRQYATPEQLDFLKEWLEEQAPWFADKYQKLLTRATK